MSARPVASPPGRRPLAAALAALVILAFAPALVNGFVTYDDPEYVLGNAQIRSGLSTATVAWALRAVHSANWHPLTWISHATDVSLFGLWAGGHHLTSLLLHAGSAVLLFLALAEMTGAIGRSALAAAFFAVHPLRVESVAWVAERKDVLSVFFAALVLWIYARQVRAPSRRRGIALGVAFACGLMSKPMLVTLPLLLLVLDFWPLERLRAAGSGALSWPLVWLRIREKAPLFALAAASAAITWTAQQGLAVADLRAFTLGSRLSNALVATLAYLGKTLWPVDLAVFYPHPATLGRVVPTAAWASAAILLTLATGLAAREHRRRPFLIAGWLWYLVGLLPVIGIVQVGSQAMADRYTYLPSLGLAWIAAWGAAELAARARLSVPLAGALAALLVVALAVMTWRQTRVWRDSETLYRHALSLSADNWLAWNNLGIARLEGGDLGAALGCFQRAVEIYPGYGKGWYNLGAALSRLRRVSEATAAYRRAAACDARDAAIRVNLGMSLIEEGRLDEAEAALAEALRLKPEDPMALFDLALLSSRRGQAAAARSYVERLRAVDAVRARELEELLKSWR